jgi:hypothetical protein
MARNAVDAGAVPGKDRVTVRLISWRFTIVRSVQGSVAAYRFETKKQTAQVQMQARPQDIRRTYSMTVFLSD